MKFLYNMKGCAHCDSRDGCPKKLKQSEANLAKEIRFIEDRDRRGRPQKWQTKCLDFMREIRRM